MNRLGIDSEEVAELTWVTSAGCTVSINLDYLSIPLRRRMKAYGDLGTIAWDGISGTAQLMLAETTVQESRSPQTRDEMFESQIDALISAIKRNHDPRLASGAEGAKALTVCDSARLTSVSRREETVVYK